MTLESGKSSSDISPGSSPLITPSNVFGFAQHQPLDVFFNPRTLALIGATDRPGSQGRQLLWNLISNPFGGTVFPVNPNRSNALGIKTYPNLGAIPEKIDLAIIAIPAPEVSQSVTECIEKGVKGAIIVSSGFKESGAKGKEMEQEILEKARGGTIRIIGPNCLGIMRPLSGLNASLANQMARPGNVAFISQSGALCHAILDWSLRENVGFSTFISIGGMVDISWGDLIDYLGDDPHTKSIIIYMETIGDARSFLSAAREVALTKPVILIHTGRNTTANRAAASHTGALTGSFEVFEAALHRSGILSVSNISELFYMAEVLAKQPRPKGPHLSIITNAGGAGVLATEALIENGGLLADLAPESLQELDRFLPEHWSRSNPVDIMDEASPDRFARTIEIVSKDPNSDGMLVILTPQSMTDPTQTAERLKVIAKTVRKPVLASWMGGAEVAAGEMILNQAGIPTFPYPDIATKAFNLMWQYSYNLRGLYETPSLPTGADESPPDYPLVNGVIETVRKMGRTLLTELESKQILEGYGIPVVKAYAASVETEAVQIAEKLGFPVVLKLLSHITTHKSEAGGVSLNLGNSEEVLRAFQTIKKAAVEKGGPGNFLGVTVQPFIEKEGYELILGSSLDPQFGPVLLFGTGGRLVEIYRDKVNGLPPLNSTLARRMVEQTRIFKILKGTSEQPGISLFTLDQIMVRFSRLVVEQPWIKEIEINPLLAFSDQLLALDCRVVLHDPETDWENLPKTAIRPYPVQYVKPWNLKDGKPIILRPIRPEDEPLMVKFHETLSEQSVYFRYLHMLNLTQRIAHERLIRICFIDYNREMALVADYRDPASGEHQILGVGRLAKLHGQNKAEFAVLVSDQYQRQGLGTELLRQLVEVGREEKLNQIIGDIHPENRGMQLITKNLGFQLKYLLEDQIEKAWLNL